MEYLESLSVAEDAKEQFIQENEPELDAAIKEKQKEIEACKKEIARAAKRGDLESTKEYQAKWESLNSEISEMEKGYAEKLAPYDDKIADISEKYDECDTKIAELESLAEQMEKDFEAECRALKEDRRGSWFRW